MSALKRLEWLLRRWLDAYPAEPLVYACSHNGVTGIVRAEDFDDEVRRMRKELIPFRHANASRGAVRPQVYPVFLFSDKKPERNSYRVGSLQELGWLLRECFVEERSFELPPLSAPGLIPDGYFGMKEAVEESIRHRVWTMGQAHLYVYREIDRIDLYCTAQANQG